MATAGYKSVVYVTTTDTNPSSSDILGGIQSFNWAATKAELDTGILGETFTSLILGKSTVAPAVTCLYTPADTGQSRLITAWGSGATVWIHHDPFGTGSCYKAGIKVSGYPIKAEQAGLITVDYALKSTTALGTSTVS